jgi:hypothetical protein
MPHYKLLFPNNYVGAWDMEGGDRKVKIKAITVEDLYAVDTKKTKKKPVISFERVNKKLVLNKTNGAILSKLFGNKTETWIGKEIVLYSTTCLAFGERVECTRVRETPGTSADAGLEDKE